MLLLEVSKINASRDQFCTIFRLSPTRDNVSVRFSVGNKAPCPQGFFPHVLKMRKVALCSVVYALSKCRPSLDVSESGRRYLVVIRPEERQTSSPRSRVCELPAFLDDLYTPAFHKLSTCGFFALIF
jgi:hypothetical protein